MEKCEKCGEVEGWYHQCEPEEKSESLPVRPESAGLRFIDGLMFASQFMAVDHREGGFAEDILRASGFSRRDLLSAQRKSGYESRKMCKIIRRATPNSRITKKRKDR